MQLNALKYPNKQTPNALHSTLTSLICSCNSRKQMTQELSETVWHDSSASSQQIARQNCTKQHQTASHSLHPRTPLHNAFIQTASLQGIISQEKEGASDGDLIGPHKLQAQQLTPKSALHFTCCTFLHLLHLHVHLLPAATEEHNLCSPPRRSRSSHPPHALETSSTTEPSASPQAPMLSKTSPLQLDTEQNPCHG